MGAFVTNTHTRIFSISYRTHMQTMTSASLLTRSLQGSGDILRIVTTFADSTNHRMPFILVLEARGPVVMRRQKNCENRGPSQQSRRSIVYPQSSGPGVGWAVPRALPVAGQTAFYVCEYLPAFVCGRIHDTRARPGLANTCLSILGRKVWYTCKTHAARIGFRLAHRTRNHGP